MTHTVASRGCVISIAGRALSIMLAWAKGLVEEGRRMADSIVITVASHCE